MKNNLRVLSALGLGLLVVALAACAGDPPPVKSPLRQVSQGAPPAYAQAVAVDGAEAAGPFARWSAVIVSADQQAGGGGTTEAFDNARRDITDQLVKAGFARPNIAQFSASGGSEGGIDEPTPDGLKAVLGRMMGRAGEGCLLYITSHGDKTGVVFGQEMLKPEKLSSILNSTCGLRPTVAIVSACYSGVFLQPLEGPHRLVMTAARPDRSSFGCGTDDRYPFFDACMIEALPEADGFLSLPARVSACVSRREKEQGLLASEPQLSIGAGIEPVLKSKPFGGR